jgi:hypothetical protein
MNKERILDIKYIIGENTSGERNSREQKCAAKQYK